MHDDQSRVLFRHPLKSGSIPAALGFVAALAVLTVPGAAAIAASSSTRAENPSPQLLASASRIEADVRFLADDLLEGREAGTRGHEIAALYVATQYRHMGLQPAGDGGTYLQAVPMLRGVRDRDGAKFAVTRDAKTTELRFEQDFLPGLDYDTGSCSVANVPMVFVGQAVVAPELKHDDFAGVDVRGKAAVVLGNAPARFPIDQRAFYANGDEKARELERRGAVGIITLTDPENESKYPWQKGAVNWARPGMRVLAADGKPMNSFPGLRCSARLPVAQADLLFTGSPYTADQVYEMLGNGELKSFDLTGTVTMASRTKLERVTSRNVVGRVPAGARSSALAGEHVVLSAHLDHVGLGAPVNSDSIYNGAQDNAVGVAEMLEAGRLLMQQQSKLRRSVLLVATTAEEKGLLGAQYFAANPTVPKGSMVANVNLDMPTHLAAVTDAIPIGIEHSTLEAVARKAVAAAGMTLTPDPMPEEVLFVRSDQYPFIREGIPAVYLGAGVKRTDGKDGLAEFQGWLQQHYHRPSDDLNQPIDWLGAARLANVNFQIAMAIATQGERPKWKEGDFFGGKFGQAPSAQTAP